MSEFFHVGPTSGRDAERTRTEQLERQKQEQRYLGSLLRLPGMRLYEFNYKTGECREVGTETKLENAIRKLVKAGYVKMVQHDGKGPHVEDR